MNFRETELQGVMLIEPVRFEDNRGFFSECYNRKKYDDYGIAVEFVQDNHSFSIDQGTVRGLHFQNPPFAQDKLVRCGRGSIFDVAVDIRVNSPSYGKWVGYELSETNGRQLYIPSGFAHGFMTLEPNSEILYKCSGFYQPNSEGSLRWDDPEINISWPEVDEIVLSEKDSKAGYLSEFTSEFVI